MLSPGRCKALTGLLLLLAVGCAGSPPPVKVIGVTGAQDRADASDILLVFLQVQNPTKRDIQISRLDYRMEAEPWFMAKGTVALSRTLAAGASAVLEIPVRLEGVAPPPANAGIPYALRGTLFANSGSLHRSWPVRVDGELAPGSVASAAAVFAAPGR